MKEQSSYQELIKAKALGMVILLGIIILASS